MSFVISMTFLNEFCLIRPIVTHSCIIYLPGKSGRGIDVSSRVINLVAALLAQRLMVMKE